MCTIEMDQMSLMLMLDNQMSDQIEALAPHKNVIDINNPRTLTGAATMPKPVASTISNWIAHNRVLENDPIKRQFLESLAMT